MQLTGLHHVTAITAGAAQNLAFYTQVLGMRLVKKTVNQDDTSAYHLFYADATGSPGTDLTFFDWPQTPENRIGTGSISRIGLRVSGGKTLAWWAQRLADLGTIPEGIAEEGGLTVLRFADPEGQRLVLVDDGGAPGGTPWARSPVPAEKGIRGLHSVTLTVEELADTAEVLTDVLGFERVRDYPSPDNPSQQMEVFATGSGGAGAEVHVESRPDLMPVRLGWGGVHHVAFRTPDDEQQLEWRQRILKGGLGVTRVIDRFYFKSIYFRIPGGILFEIATDGPGFATDEDVNHLGETLALPPFLEPQRAQIEAGLHPIEMQGEVTRE